MSEGLATNMQVDKVIVEYDDLGFVKNYVHPSYSVEVKLHVCMELDFPKLKEYAKKKDKSQIATISQRI